MNILILTTSFPSKTANTIGGKFVLHEALAYAKNGANVKVITPYFEGALGDETIDYNVKIKRFKYFFPNNLQKLIDPVNPLYHSRNKFIKILNIPFFILSFLYAVFKHSKNVDIVHCQWTTSVLFALPFRCIRKYKIVTTARGSDIRVFPKWLNKFIMKKVDASINCYGEVWYETLKEYPSNYIELPLITLIKEKNEMPNDLKIIFDKNIKSFKIVYLGRFDKIKIENSAYPLLILINSMKSLVEKGYDVVLVYIGDGALINEMKNIVDKFNLKEKIYFLGSKLNPEDYLLFFHLGFGGVNTDAVTQEMSVVGLPQVQASHNKWMKVNPWKNKENMFIFESYNEKSLTETIQFAIENPEILKKVSLNIRNDIKQYVLDYKIGGQKYLETFEKILIN